jgi:hypothetical protein
VCADDLRAGGVGLHALAERDGEWIDAEEAFVSVAALDRDEGGEWYCETYWLSDLVTAEGDPDHARAAIRGLERTIARLNAWLEAEKPEA